MGNETSFLRDNNKLNSTVILSLTSTPPSGNYDIDNSTRDNHQRIFKVKMLKKQLQPHQHHETQRNAAQSLQDNKNNKVEKSGTGGVDDGNRGGIVNNDVIYNEELFEEKR